MDLYTLINALMCLIGVGFVCCLLFDNFKVKLDFSNIIHFGTLGARQQGFPSTSETSARADHVSLYNNA